MRKLILVLVFAVAAFAQRGGHSSIRVGHTGIPMQHSESVQRGWPVTHGYYRPIRPVGPIVVVVRPGLSNYYSGYGWNYYFGLGYWPYYYENSVYGPGGITVPAYQALPCKKESLKDSSGSKHDVLICVQPDSSIKVVADGDMLAVPKLEVKQ
jgi:hypothetical protein